MARVLEIGTGTGYNAALMCHRFGAQNVYSIDIDPELVGAAADALATIGQQPLLVAGDGYEGIPAGAPYDRIIATCAVTHVPPEWIRQLAVGGRIIAPVAGNAAVPMLVLDKVDTDEVVGRFAPITLAFMPLRATVENPLGPGETTGLTPAGMAHYGLTEVDPYWIAHCPPEMRLFLQFHIPGLRLAYTAGKSVVAHTATSVARVELSPDGHRRWPVFQYGHRIWDTVEAAVATWGRLGGPEIARFGISALDNVHRQYVWLDEPNGHYSWPMPI